ncbi:MAG: hypothetical protein PVH61_00470 [Candidatus Aminicenantes bacterium]
MKSRGSGVISLQARRILGKKHAILIKIKGQSAHTVWLFFPREIDSLNRTISALQDNSCFTGYFLPHNSIIISRIPIPYYGLAYKLLNKFL